MNVSSIVSRVFLICSVVLGTSCQVYRSQFDCAPSSGVPCASVSEIESRIVETTEGPDLFLKSHALRPSVPEEPYVDSSMRRVWIPPAKDPSGTVIEGHYVYIGEGNSRC